MTTRRRVILGAAGALVAGAARAGPFNHVGPEVAVPNVSHFLTGALGASEVPALGYAVIGPKGVTRLEVAGRRRLDREDLVQKDDPWHLGSNTEALTSALYGRLVEAGQSAWGANLGFLFPDLKLHPAWTDVTLEEVLSHRAGVSDVGIVDLAFLRSANRDPRPIQDQRSDLARRVLEAPPGGKRREYDYANLDYVIAGAAIERIVRTSWEDALARLVFQPLDLESAGFGPPVGEVPWGHEVDERGALRPVDPEGPGADNPRVLAPGGQAHLSLPDYAKFLTVFTTGGGGFLKPETLRRLARPQDAFTDGDALGWRVSPVQDWAEGPVLTHEGSNTLWRAEAQIAPARPLALAVVTNAGGEPGARGAQMMMARLLSDEMAQAS